MNERSFILTPDRIRYDDIKAHLLVHAEPEYRLFSSGLIPNASNVMGVRLPELRKLARLIAKGDWMAYLDEAQDDTFEEVMLQGMVIGYARADIEVVLLQVARFVPKIDNWSVCDSFCIGLKTAGKHRERMWSFLQPYLDATNEYDLRFAIVMLLNYYVEDTYLDEVLSRLDQVAHEGYYVKMAVAWALASCYDKFPERTMAYLRNSRLDKWTYNKALQKVIESTRSSQETKQLIRSMKRK